MEKDHFNLQMTAVVLSEHIILIPVIRAVTTGRCRMKT